MSRGTFKDFRELRERLVNLRAATVAELAGIPRGRLDEIEQGASPSVFEIERLATVYGIDADALWDDPIRLADSDTIEVLTSQEEFRGVTDMTRAKILRAASAARDLVTLRRLLGDTFEPLPKLPSYPPNLSPYEQGAELAHALRVALGLGVGPIPSVRDLVATKLPSIAVLDADLGRDGPAGLGFADATRGPAVVLNLRGKNENAAVRRFSLAHELCHLLVDWNRADPLASISGYLSDTALEREQRANGFAIRLLCPETVVQRLRTFREDDAARVLIEEYKLHYRAARQCLEKEVNMHLPKEPPATLRPLLGPDPSLARDERSRAVEDFPLEEVPFERRGIVAETAARAWARGLIPRDACARFLGITPGSEIERVADYFGEDLPQEQTLTG
jgi:Zn-dependent peptidase ImmA (M78 family)